MKTNLLRPKLYAEEVSVGCQLGLGSPNVCELLAQAGFDWLIIETEHNAVDLGRIEHMLMAAQGTEATVLVRVPSANPLDIQRALDIGAEGILVPMVRTPEEARAIVAATRYPPGGVRGYGPLRASRYGLSGADYLRRANDNIVVILIIETPEALANLDAIAAVDGVDVLFMGLFDLSLGLGLDPMQLPHPQTDEASLRVIQACAKHGKPAGCGIGDPELLPSCLEKGFRMIGYTDYMLLANAAGQALAAKPKIEQ
jgi:2-keto-3-deoxy-L-rhamnonate aldolase RhmA